MDVQQSSSAAAVPGVPADLPPRVCGGCGYPLTGLPDDGQCPECGSSYGRDQVVLAGWAIGAHETIANFGTPSQARLSSEGFAQRDGCGQAKLMPWSCARVVKLAPAGLARYRLEISEENHIGKWVAIEFECTPAQAEHLRQFIARLRGRSAGTS